MTGAGDESGDRRQAALALASRHALGWLVATGSIGLLLALLLLAPDAGRLLGPFTYGRLMPLHLNFALYGWLSLPLVALLLSAYLPADGGGGTAAVRLWSASLAVGAAAWLFGSTSGKSFLDWTGISRALFFGNLLVLALVLAAGLARRWRAGERAGLPARGVLWLALLGVPIGLAVATSPATYPPINPSTGGPTGASLLGSTLAVIAIFAGTPLLLGLPAHDGGRFERRSRATLEVFGALAVHAAFLAAVGLGERSHRDPWQIAAVASLLVWAALLPRWLRRFAWPLGSRPWLAAFYAWGGLLLATATVMFLPGLLDRIKFTNALVGHAHLAMAGLATSFAALILAALDGGAQLTRALGEPLGFALWHGGNGAQVAALVAAGALEAADPGIVFRGDWPVTALYGVRAAGGAAMLAAAWRVFLRARPAGTPAEAP